MTLGFASGPMDNEQEFLERLNFFQSIGCNAIELHPSDVTMANKNFSPAEISAISTFEYVSLHYRKSDTNFEMDARTDVWLQSLPIQLVVIHPDLDLNTQILATKNWPIALENMDKHKDTAKAVESMQEWLGKFPKAGMVLDINHCFTNDPSMKLARDLYTEFSARIKEIHFSGYMNEDFIHEPVTTSDCEYFSQYIPDKNLPIILEVFTARLSKEELKSEFDFVSQTLH